jgi:DNA mismatch repair protein MutS2
MKRADTDITKDYPAGNEAEAGGRHLRDLDWPEVLSQLASLAQSDRGRAACLTLPLLDDPDAARARMAEVVELMAVLETEGRLASLSFPEIAPLLDAAGKGVALGAEELRQLADFCEAAANARRFFARRAPGAGSGPAIPLVWELVGRLSMREALIRKARETFDATGEIRDSASPALARLRRERDDMAERVRTRAEDLLQSETFTPYLQDSYVTLRADRFVLPVRASFKAMGLGIVHDTSRTGETVFIEPTEIVELNNRLKVSELEIRHESRRILEELAALVAEEAPGLRQDLEVMTRLDLLCAEARFSAACGAVAVEVAREPVLDLRQLRHPLLVLRNDKDRRQVVANDVALGGSGRARLLIVSGPNAGGKTVLLKSVGLAALLVRAGLPVPVGRGSVVGFFHAILSDVGDGQSLMGDLSTFSAHLANLADMLAVAEKAELAGANVLALCDELAAGTNPEQGAALARAILERLSRGRAVGVTTTHYDSLKALADGDPSFRNAGMEYDLAHLAPTFKLRDGQPGRSYALDIAARMGLPESVLARARELAGAASLGLEEIVRDLQAREQSLATQEAALAELNAELEARAAHEKAATHALEKRERELAVKTREKVEAAVRETRAALAEILDRARSRTRAADAAEVERAAHAARQDLESTIARVTADLPEPPPLDLAKLKEALASRALGVGAKTNARAPGTPTRNPRSAPDAPSDDSALSALRARANTVDLRGLRADEALGELERFLDRTALDGADLVFIVHGHGQGALRRAIREYLALSPYVQRSRPGTPAEGGDGVTIAALKG